MNREIVARIFNPLYRRFVIGRVGKSWALGLSDAPAEFNLQQSATRATASTRRFMVPRTLWALRSHEPLIAERSEKGQEDPAVFFCSFG